MYATAADLYITFGKQNVTKWADVNNNNVPDEIDDRIEWALEQASAELDARLKNSPLQFPLEEPGSGESYPAIVIRMTCYLAGLLLYESRGVTDAEGDHQLKWCEKRVDRFVRDVWVRRVSLGIEVPIETSESPFFIEFDDPAEE